MKKLLSTLSLLLLFSVPVLAQSDGSISGTVLDQENEPLSSASVAIYDSTQSNIITGASTDNEGSFSINISPGQYVLKVTFLSFKPYIQQFQISEGETTDLGTINMTPTSEDLGELFVRAERSEMQMNFDKRTFQVGQDITSLGGSAVDVLNNVPSVSTDIDGNISLRGNESVRVLINGKPSNMASNSNVDALNSIPATMIKSVEIITNPSARYAAEGSGGIINIILKKDQRRGFNGSFQVGTGLPEEYEGSANLNYRVGDINWFFNGGLDYSSEPEGGSSFQRFSGPDTTYMYREQTDSQESELDGDLQFGADFYLTETQVLTASAYLSAERGENIEDITYTDLEYSPGAFTGDVLKKTYRENRQESNEGDIDINLNYENKIDGNDHKLVADASFDISREKSTNNIEETVRQGNEDPLMQRAIDEEEEMDLRFNAEYKRPIWGDGKLEAGLRSDTEWMDNSYLAETRVNGTWVSEENYTDNFLYTENVNAAFAILNYEWSSLSGQVGLRLENTNIRTEVKSDNTVVTQNYVNLFPSVFLSYSFNEQQSVQVSYSRRLQRPWSRALIPFNDFDDQRSQFTGNPNLTPEFSNSYELGYLHYWNSGSLLTSFYHRYRTDVIERITEAQQGVTRIFPINLASEKAWGVEFSADQEIADRLNLTANANLFRSNSEGTYQDQVFSSESENFRARMRLRWEIVDGLNYQASMRYRGPSETTQGRREGMTMIDTGVSKDLMDGKAKISLNIRDLLNSQNFSYTANTDGNPNTDFYTQREFSWSSRSATISFQYFFGERNKEQKRRDQGPNGDGPPEMEM
ncbi:TonB-dependent receptor [Fodinibius sp.]|uniref:TonB-dependent receptor n=1 Tax=Fodinibius sp. TaxID=1872440 RepID=UPI002ACE5A21|nr:TonB-dependent receptor [Fodinibius sp.]MDZ7658156.1 TonB-dependent receptor [Fodinibius sp.]